MAKMECNFMVGQCAEAINPLILATTDCSYFMQEISYSFEWCSVVQLTLSIERVSFLNRVGRGVANQQIGT